MTRSVREAFERGTATFNAHDTGGFAEVLAADVVFEAPGGIRGKGKDACVGFFASWFAAFPDAHVDVHGLHVVDQVAVEEGTFTGTHSGVLHHPMGDIPPTGRTVRIAYIQVLRFRDGQHVSFNPDVRPLVDDRAARCCSGTGTSGVIRSDRLRGCSPACLLEAVTHTTTCVH